MIEGVVVALGERELLGVPVPVRDGTALHVELCEVVARWEPDDDDVVVLDKLTERLRLML